MKQVSKPPEWAGYFRRHPALFFFVLALSIRLIYMITLAVRPGFSTPIVDEVAFDEMARQFETAFSFGSEPFFRPPLWPLLLGVSYVIFNSALPVARFLNLILGALTVASTYRLGLKLFDRNVAAIASLILTFYGLLLHFDTSYLSTSLATYLCIEALNLSISSRAGGNWRRSLSAGLLWGLAALAWPVSLLPAVIVAGENLFVRQRKLPGRIRRSLLILVGIICAVTPVTIHNCLKGDFALISTNGGINLFIGNNEASNGVEAIHPALGELWTPDRAHDWAESMTGRKLQPGEVSRFYSGQALRFWREQPLQALGLSLKKLYISFSGAEISNNADLDFIAHDNPLFRTFRLVGFGVLIPFALVGFALGLRWSGAHRLSMAVAMSYLAASTVFFVTARFRIPPVPVLALFAAYSSRSILFSSSLKSRLKIVIPVLLLGILANSNLTGIPRGGNLSRGYFLRGQTLAKENRPQEALEAFYKSLEYNPSAPLANCYIAEIALMTGKAELAIRHFKLELELLPDSDDSRSLRYRVYRGLGLAFRQEGMHSKAESAFSQALALEPGDLQVRIWLEEEMEKHGLAALNNGCFDEAEKVYAQAASVNPDNPNYPLMIAVAEWLGGKIERAESRIDSLVAIHPDFQPALQWRTEGWRPVFSPDDINPIR